MQEIMNRMPASRESSIDGSESDGKIEGGDKMLARLDGRKDPLFFEFFSIYTAQSVRQTHSRARTN